MDNNKDVLSQEEIDALLQGDGDNSGGDSSGGNNDDPPGGGGGTGDGGNGDDYLDDIQKDTIGEIGNISMGTAATTLSVLLNQQVSITTPKVSITDYSTLRNEFPKPYVAVEVEYLEGLEGVNVLILKEEDAKIIANLMMGGDGTDIQEGEIEEFHMSAVSEAMNQMMGSASTSMSDMFGMSINISPPQTKKLDLSSEEAEDELPQDPLIKVAFDLKVGNLIDSEIMQLIPLKFAKDMVSSLTEANAKSEDDSSSSSEAAAANEKPSKVQASSDKTSQEREQAPAQNVQKESGQPQQGQTQAEPKKDYQPVEFSQLKTDNGAAEAQVPENIGLIMDVPLDVSVELGRTNKKIQDILELVPGSIIELDKVAGEPVDIKVNGKLIAKGEVVVIDENFGIRITDIISPKERINKIQ